MHLFLSVCMTCSHDMKVRVAWYYLRTSHDTGKLYDTVLHMFTKTPTHGENRELTKNFFKNIQKLIHTKNQKSGITIQKSGMIPLYDSTDDDVKITVHNNLINYY